MRHLLLSLLLLLAPSLAWGAETYNPFTSRPDLCSTIVEEDGSPLMAGCQPIEVPNGTLTDDGDGSWSLAAGASGAVATITLTPTTSRAFEWWAANGAIGLSDTTNSQQLLQIGPNNQLLLPAYGAGILTVTPNSQVQSTMSPIVTALTGTTITTGSGGFVLQNGELLTNSSNGIITFAGEGQTNNENLTLDFETTANTITASSSTSLTNIVFTGITLSVLDDRGYNLGTANADARLEFDTAETNDTLKLSVVVGTSADSGNILITEFADRDVNFGVGIVANPTIRIQSADATTTTDALRLWHDQTNGTLDTGGGNLNIAPAGGTVAVTGAVTATTDITSSDTGDIGWSIVDSTDNTACTTICTSAAVHGWDGTTPVGPTSALADICLCAGGS